MHVKLSATTAKLVMDARVYTDDFHSYNALPGDKHLSVKHGEGEYSDGNGMHVNTVEAEFSMLRPWIETFRGASKEGLYLYIGHYEFFRNHRDIDPIERTLKINHASMDMISYKRNISVIVNNSWSYENPRNCKDDERCGKFPGGACITRQILLSKSC